MIRRTELTVTTDSAGAGTVTSGVPINGEVVELRNNGAAWGTATYAFTRAANESGGTVLSGALAAPFSVYPGGSVYGGGPSAVTPGLPVEGYLTMTVAGGGSVIAGTVHAFYRAGGF